MKIKLDVHITPEIYNVLKILEDNNGHPRFVGGCVRDSLIGIKSSDIDVITTLLPEEVMKIMHQNNIKCIDTGSKYGTVTAITDEDKIEITSLRIDTECDGRHTKAIFTDNFEEDALRRDFTINAMSYSPFSEELYDYAGGRDDLLAKKVRFIGDAEKRIEEDHLRILRFFRFSDRYANELDKAALSACIKMKELITKLSKERILMELSKLLSSSTAHKVLKHMIDGGIMHVISPLITWDISLFPEVNSSHVTVKYATLMYKTPLKLLKDELYRMHFRHLHIKMISDLVEFKNAHPDVSKYSIKELKRAFYPLWVDGQKMEPFAEITEAQKYKNFEPLKIMFSEIPPEFPVSGDDLIKKELNGKEIGAALEKLKFLWIEKDFNISKEELLATI